MRKLLLAGLLLVPSFASAQIGLKGGLVMAKLGGDDVDDAKYKMGLALGASYSHPLTGSLVLRPEALFVMKGAKFDAGGTDVTYKGNYLEIPILFVYGIPMEGSFQPNVYAGPAIGLKIGTPKREGGGQSMDVEDVKALDLGLALGAGAAFGQITAELRYTHGLTTTDGSDAENDVKNRTIMIMAGYNL